jgi:fatty-acyl-CoA synthase
MMEEMRTRTVGGALDLAAGIYPDSDALVYADRGLRYSYRELNRASRDVAAGLLAMGIRKGDHVAIWANNVPEWVILQFATAKIGAVLVTINTAYMAHELEYVLRQSDATTLFLVEQFRGTSYVDLLDEVVPELALSSPGRLQSPALPCLKSVVLLGDGSHPGAYRFSDIAGMNSADGLADLEQVEAGLQADEVINMQYTSGTTGFPKGVMLTHANVVNNGFAVGECMRLTTEDRVCIPVPFFHCFGCVLGVLACVTHGAAMVPVETFCSREGTGGGGCREVHRVAWRAHDVHCRARRARWRRLRPVEPPHRHHGRRTLSGRGHAQGHRRDARVRDHNRLRTDRVVTGYHADAHRGSHRAPGPQRRAGPPRCRGEDRGSG